MTSILQQLPVKKQRLIPQKPSELVHGNVGILSSLATECQCVSTSTDYQSLQETLSCLPSLKPSEKLLSHQEIMDLWWKEQLSPPFHMWHRPSGQTTGWTRDWTTTHT